MVLNIVGLTRRFCSQNGRGVSDLAGRRVLGTSRECRQWCEFLRFDWRVKFGGLSMYPKDG